MAKKLKKRKNLYAAGGMYASNTIPAGLTTTNLVADESNPEVLQAREQQFSEQQLSLQSTTKDASEQIKEDEINANQDIEQAAAQSNAQFATGEGVLKTLQQKIKNPENTSKTSNPFASALSAGRITKASNLASKATTFNASTGVNAITNAKAATKAVNLAQKAGGSVMSSAETGKTIVTNAAGDVVGTGSSIGAGLKNFATSGAGIGTIASLAGAGIKKLSNDNDATTLNFGEGTGAVLAGVGTGIGAAALAGAAMGSAVPVIGNIIGGVAGAAYGLIKGLTGRNKARRAKKKAEAQKAKYVSKVNKNTKTQFATGLSSVRSSELKSKTFSGYDQGFNTTAKTGGLRLGMPRYGN
tara:strand:+ start:842 stop:1909 length:1068 start_codon:yes stop_codon:yes gene_type:complete